MVQGAAFPSDIGDRVIRYNFNTEWHGRDAEVVTQRDELRSQLAAADQMQDINVAPIRAESAAGLFYTIEPAVEILRRIVAEAEGLLRSRPGVLFKLQDQ